MQTIPVTEAPFIRIAPATSAASSRESAHRVCVLVPPDVVPLDLVIPLQVFGEWPGHIGSFGAGDGPYLVTLAGMDGAEDTAPLTARTLLGLEELEQADTIVVPGTRSPMTSVDEPTVRALRAAGVRGARFVAICTGAFIVAAAGLLDGHRATTHWAWAAELRRHHPEVEVLEQHLYIDEGQVITSAGVLAGVDACLHVVRRDQGLHVANGMARFLVSAPHRSGDQAQFIEAPAPSGDGDLAGLLTWIEENLSEPHTLANLARRARLSERTLSRRFKISTGSSVLAWVTARRVERARVLLETTRLPVTVIAHACGFSSDEALRVNFTARTSMSPSAYRRSFG